MDWNNTVLSIAGQRIDFVIVHHYPYSTSAAEMLTKPRNEIPAMASALRSLINRYAGANAPNVGIAVTEASSQFAPYYGLQALAPLSIQMAVVTLTLVPILVVCPFVRRHFVKGMLIGAIKG